LDVDGWINSWIEMDVDGWIHSWIEMDVDGWIAGVEGWLWMDRWM
jgi:hypothetical protein